MYGNNGKQTDRWYYVATAKSLATTSSDYERRGSFSSEHIFVPIPLIVLHQCPQSDVFADVLSLYNFQFFHPTLFENSRRCTHIGRILVYKMQVHMNMMKWKVLGN